MEDNPTENPVQFWSIYFVIVGVILFVGWKQPLKYRFMSKAQIYAIEHPYTPVPSTPRPTPPAGAPSPTPHWMWNPDRKTPLDRPSYNQTTSPWGSRYTTPLPARTQ